MSPQQHYTSGKTPQEMPSELLWNNEKHQAISDNRQDHINHIRKINTDLKRVFQDTVISTTNQSNINPQEASGTWMLTRSTSNSINSDWTTNPKIQNQNQRNQNPKTAMMKKSISSDNEEPKPKRLSKRYRDLLMQSSQMNNEQLSNEENVSSVTRKDTGTDRKKKQGNGKPKKRKTWKKKEPIDPNAMVYNIEEEEDNFEEFSKDGNF
ncbi:hypothetical protein AGABI2DRAFT_121746 [Agaricus bisporus var. bisporus H97]|uniref:hypothetical protein n=1 Tax=Agaricus bisporus var. bisporus (strain H97 / ATCC MYA-4626 / FGSC 10389) TaxID=936046 RepID=UPI00029F63AF|nr:hypothetical protein AGABI2DRAFT_121746 [Agaricus bisporus var. bisporus H97]EKV43602.1 hypothetical protein AGABI2DRAFT_121746 [Agaricus bisporus var. bisporus H97]